MFQRIFNWVFKRFPSNQESFLQQHRADLNRLRTKMDAVDAQVELSEYNPVACSQFAVNDHIDEFELVDVNFVAEPVFPGAAIQEDLIGDEWMDYPPPK